MLRTFGGRAAALRWSYLSQWWLLVSQSADDMAPIRVAGFGYIEHAMSRYTDSPNLISNLRKHFFTFLLFVEFDFSS